MLYCSLLCSTPINWPSTASHRNDTTFLTTCTCTVFYYHVHVYICTTCRLASSNDACVVFPHTRIHVSLFVIQKLIYSLTIYPFCTCILIESQHIHYFQSFKPSTILHWATKHFGRMFKQFRILMWLWMWKSVVWQKNSNFVKHFKTLNFKWL